ncbi:DUF434 domain-containing protein [Thermosulfurimonas marina]|uniref:DUF434 domain-containing protein n=1 Tax=Thermosulfurimonas marina TaxID=2047767 RepID=UPI00144ABD1C|nr:DUF434 domain-containing protein [Thermosulfurimonas marina]
METFRKAARDLAWLLDRGYPERASLKLVGDRYGLSSRQRALLLRAVVPEPRASFRRKKKVPARALRGRKVTVDGYNVLATLVHGLEGRTLVLARDGFVRDAEGAGRRLRLAPRLPEALELLREFFRRYPPAYLGLYLDAPVSGSGELAAHLRKTLLQALALPGEVLALPEAERRVLSGEVVCTADGALLDEAPAVFDLAGHLLRGRARLLRPF